jgi:hypothetical protein
MSPLPTRPRLDRLRARAIAHSFRVRTLVQSVQARSSALKALPSRPASRVCILFGRGPGSSSASSSSPVPAAESLGLLLLSDFQCGSVVGRPVAVFVVLVGTAGSGPGPLYRRRSSGATRPSGASASLENRFPVLRPRPELSASMKLLCVRSACFAVSMHTWPGLARWFFLKPSRVSCSPCPGPTICSQRSYPKSSSVFVALITGFTL